MSFIKIPNSFVQEYEYDSETIFIYALLQKMLSVRGKIIFTFKWLLDNLYIDKNNTVSRKRVKNILLQLEHDDYIKLNCDIKKVNKNELIIADFKTINSFFVQVTDDEFNIIHNYNNKDFYNIFCLFTSIKSRISYTGYCYPSFDMLKGGTGIKSDTSISDYLKILKNELNLIGYRNLGIGVNDNKISQLNNVFTLKSFNNYEEILEQAINIRKAELKDYFKKIEKGENTNKKRSEKMKEYWSKIKENGGK